MRPKHNELAAVVYADLFGYPLTVSEARLWAVREIRQKNSERKLVLAKTVTETLAKIPTVEGIFLTGSVAAGNAKKNADVDLMIITTPNTLWLTRLVVVLWLEKEKIYRWVCPNIFLDTRHLEIEERNLYTAHEVLQAKCLFDRGGVERKWLTENKWTREYLPRAYKYYVSCIKYYAHKTKPSSKYIIHNTLYILFELVAFGFQYLFMKRKITNERVGWGFAFFHPRNLSEKVVTEFNRRVQTRQGRR